MNTRTDSYGGSLENRARFLQILKAVREAVGPDFLVELRIDGTDHQPGGITPEETGAFVAMAEPYITSVHVTCGIYEASVKSGTESSMFHPHGLNIDNAAIIKKYTKLPVGAVGGINSPSCASRPLPRARSTLPSWAARCWPTPSLPTRPSAAMRIRSAAACAATSASPAPPRRAMTTCPSPARSWPSTWATAPSTPGPPALRSRHSGPRLQAGDRAHRGRRRSACRPPSPPATGARRSSWPSRAPPGRPAAVHRRGHRQARPDELQEPAGARGGAP
ncbi:hypothetical protein M5E87_13890 [Flavonifractor plautii]|nr:hypothetical protein M5E87_13890 [Flavonifractor plautii]